MFIDPDGANLLIDACRKINSLKGMLQDTFNSGFKDFLESVKVLSSLMEKTIKSDSEEVAVKNLSETINHVDNMIKFNKNNDSISFRRKPEILSCLDEILNDLKLLRAKIARQGV